MYASRLSTVSTHSDYPSDLSSLRAISLKHSMLGLTDSPLSRASPVTHSAPSTLSAFTPAARLKDHSKRSKSNPRQSHSAASLEAARSPRQINATQPDIDKSSSNRPRPNKADAAIAESMSSGQMDRKVHRKPVPAPQRQTKQPDESFAGESEEGLVGDVKSLNLHEQIAPPPNPTSDQLRADQRRKDAEWERSGMWEKEQSAAGEAEDRMRRDEGREIAYPPTRPRVPVRAGASGVTSIHLGVRPRLHPSRLAISIERNQPDYALPLPMFSPGRHTSPLPGEDELLRTAQRQYEQWLSKKQEREGGVGGDGWGTRDWTPRDRVVARPGALRPEPEEMRAAPPDMSTRSAETYDLAAQSIQHNAQMGSGMAAQPLSTTSSFGSGSENELRATTPTETAQQWYDPYAAMWQGYYPYDPAIWQQYGWDQGWQQQDLVQSDDDERKHVQFDDTGDQGQPAPFNPPQYDAMMYTQYAMGGMGGYNPMMGGMMMPGLSASGGPQGFGVEGEIRAFDPGQLKRGRNGHYGYLEGRELAGPPVGYLPAGVTQPVSAPSQVGTSVPAHAVTGAGHPHSQQTVCAPSVAGYAQTTSGYAPPTSPVSVQRSAWGDPSNLPRARYDGSAAGVKYVQADMDTPYPRDGSGGMTSAWTRYGPSNEIVNGIDGRMGMHHRRQREGRA